MDNFLNPISATLMKLYGRGSIVREAKQSRRDFTVNGLGALDVRTTKPDGSSWDVSRRAQGRRAREFLDELEPDFVIYWQPSLRSLLCLKHAC